VDLTDISHSMSHWEMVAPLLGLSANDVSDIKETHPCKPELQR